MKLLTFFRVAVLATLLSWMFGSVAAADHQNIVLICVDDLKPALACYGDPLARTPNIDRLASRGLLFEKAYCNQAVCAPSRNALMTGSLPVSLGIYDLGTNFRLAVPDAVTLPQLFKQNGWRTEGVGKILHTGHGNSEDPASWSVPHVYAPGKGKGSYVLEENAKTSQTSGATASKNPRERKLSDPHKGAAYEIAEVPDDAYVDGRIANEAIRRLRSAKTRTDEPFFLAVGFIKPHLPFCAPKKYWDMYDPAAFELAELRTPPVGAPEYAPQFGGELRGYVGIPAEGELPEDLQRKLIHGYYACVSYMDAQVGKVLDELDRLKLTDNTIIVFWGDHGWHLGDHGIWCKHTNYEQANRIPLIISATGVTRAASRSSSLVETVDLYPTLCEVAGLPKPKVPQSLDGVGLRPVLTNPETSVKDHVRHVYPRRGRLGVAVRTDRYRLVAWKPTDDSTSGTEYELYDYTSDPLESKNLAEEQPEVVAKLRKLLDSHPEPRPQVKAKKPKAKTKK